MKNTKQEKELFKNLKKVKKIVDKRKLKERTCRVCGCTENHACKGGCYWVEQDLCSNCSKPETKTHSLTIHFAIADVFHYWTAIARIKIRAIINDPKMTKAEMIKLLKELDKMFE